MRTVYSLRGVRGSQIDAVVTEGQGGLRSKIDGRLSLGVGVGSPEEGSTEAVEGALLGEDVQLDDREVGEGRRSHEGLCDGWGRREAAPQLQEEPGRVPEDAAVTPFVEPPPDSVGNPAPVILTKGVTRGCGVATAI